MNTFVRVWFSCEKHYFAFRLQRLVIMRECVSTNDRFNHKESSCISWITTWTVIRILYRRGCRCFSLRCFCCSCSGRSKANPMKTKWHCSLSLYPRRQKWMLTASAVVRAQLSSVVSEIHWSRYNQYNALRARSLNHFFLVIFEMLYVCVRYSLLCWNFFRRFNPFIWHYFSTGKTGGFKLCMLYLY